MDTSQSCVLKLERGYKTLLGIFHDVYNRGTIGMEIDALRNGCYAGRNDSMRILYRHSAPGKYGAKYYIVGF